MSLKLGPKEQTWICLKCLWEHALICAQRKNGIWEKPATSWASLRLFQKQRRFVTVQSCNDLKSTYLLEFFAKVMYFVYFYRTLYLALFAFAAGYLWVIWLNLLRWIILPPSKNIAGLRPIRKNLSLMSLDHFLS